MSSIKELKILQSSLIVLTQKVYGFHWNMKGKLFIVSHKQTECLFEHLSKFYDDVAEKIAMLDNVSVGTLKEALELSKIEEVETKRFNTCYVNKVIVKDIDTILDLCRNVQKSTESNFKESTVIQPMLDEIYITLDKEKWMFKAQTESADCSMKECENCASCCENCPNEKCSSKCKQDCKCDCTKCEKSECKK